MKSGLDLLEERIKKIIESSAAIFPWMDRHTQLVRNLVEAFQDHLNTLEIDGPVIPSDFRILMNREDLSSWQREPDWQIAVAQTLADTAAELDYHLDNPARVEMASSDILKPGEILFSTVSQSFNPAETNAVPVDQSRLAKGVSSKKFPNACLILTDESVFPLDKPVINLGRRSSNHLILEDLRVSRTHAQIRFVQGGFVIFDIGSSGGTYINGERVNQHRLRSGDVISLAGITMVYTEEEPYAETKPRQITSELKTNQNPGT